MNRRLDHDKRDLFPITEESFPIQPYNPVVKHKKSENLYINREFQLTQMTAREKRISDAQSSIFYEPTKHHSPKPKAGSPRPSINDHRQRMLYMASSNTLPGYSNNFENVKKQYETRTRVDENPNVQLKHKNQMFSDMFGRECGSKTQVQSKHRSVSPQFDWTQHDSIKCARDCTTSEYTNQTTSKPRSPAARISTMTKEEIDCRIQSKGLNSYKAIHGSKTKVEKVVYTGVMKWKVNYKGK